MLNIAANKKKITIAALIAIWAALIAYNTRYFRSDVDDSAMIATDNDGAAGVAQGISALAFDRQPPPYPGVHRDLFSPVSYVKDVKGQPGKIEAPTAQAPDMDEAPPEAHTPTELELLASRLRLVGLLEKKEGKVVFAYRGTELLLLKKNDILDGVFEITELEDNHIVIRQRSGTETIKITLK